MSKPKTAYYVKKQSPNPHEAVHIVAGSESWDKERWQMIKEWTQAEPNYQPVIVDAKILQNLPACRICPEQKKAVSIFKAGELSLVEQEKIIVALAKQTQAKSVGFYDEALNLIFNASERVAEIRQGNGDSVAEMVAGNAPNFEASTQKEIVESFLQWHTTPLKRDIVFGRTYRYNGLMWELISDEQLKRQCMAFFEEFNGDYTANKINKLAELIILKLAPIPLENPDFVGFQNGVLNKKTGEFLLHSPDYFLRAVENTALNTESTATPHFDDWLAFVSDSHEQKRLAILAGLYMILTNRHEWGLFLEASGVGGGGKSVLGQIATILNGQGHTTILDLKGFEDVKSRSALIGKTLVYSPDQKPYKGSADEFKAMTGGDPIKVKLLYKDEIEIKVNAVFVMSTNSPLLFTDRNGGIARRRVIIPFDREIPPEKKDVNFIDKVKAEIYGIVQKLLATFPEPSTARQILENYKGASGGLEIKSQGNHLIDFAQAFKVANDELGLFWGSNNTDKNKDNALYQAYLHYCDCQNLKPINLFTFKQALPDVLKETGQTAKVTQHRSTGGYMRTNIQWKNKDATFKEWQG
ncbi:hypothetical protein B0187_04980 [Haemophilus paracuniculus]|uniref:SF3 helicase domain-containing protein n=1 Tax=Haemophilus paracuniculus TaxID=734 RepID=A0A1T0AT73_9PAST|nr:DUF5906 domain-containing protein [Haemophilus paracuniculus]OOR99447.1 hypothetical protein B0187_04980 [Haemophilus paracuniculus]